MKDDVLDEVSWTSTEAIEDADGLHMLARRFRLTVTGGPEEAASFASEGERAVIGSHPSANLVLRDSTVSRFHCELALEGERVVLRDLKSRNGTRVEGVLIREAVLAGECTLTLGNSIVRFSLADEEVRIPLSKREQFGELRGQSRAMRGAFMRLETAARSDANVLLQGETGTGKELAAEALHQESARAAGPFVVVDCASLPAGLLESELFGHEVGAFTGATKTRMGAFEEASGGTLFLDEIGELPLDLQPKLLRAIDSRKVSRLGSVQQIPCDFRLIAATNRNLQQEVNARRFRSDLYYRLAVLTIRLPPLRERVDDIPLLMDWFSSQLGATTEARARLHAGLSQAFSHSWPGNIRELRNHVERTLATVPSTDDEALPSQPEAPLVHLSVPLREARAQHLAWFERRYLEQLLEAHDDNVAAAARTAGVARVHLHRMLSRAGLRGSSK